MIQVFSTKKNKPHHYGFTELDASPEVNTYGFNPIEFAISRDGKEWVSIYDVPDLEGVLCIDTPYVAPAKQNDEYQSVGIQDGQYLVSSSYDQRELKMTLTLSNAIDEGDVALAFDAIQKYLVQRDPYWICFANWSQRMYYVKVNEIEQTHLADSGFVVTITFQDLIGLSRSVGTTVDRMIGFGNNELNTPSQYAFTSNGFVVNNLSDVLIDPERRGHPFKMIAEGSSGGGFKVTNKTTGDSIYREKGFSGTFELDGVNPLLNGKGDLINTNHGIITLAMGKNEFTVENFSGKITFDYPMWWLS